MHNNKMDSSMILVKKSEIRVEKYLFNIEFQQNILTISYTNELYETFIGKIDQKQYEEKLNTFAKREEFSQIGDFFDILSDQKFFSIHFIDEENINFRAQMQMGKKKILIENKYKLEKMKESKLDLALKQLEAVKVQKQKLEQKLQSFEKNKKQQWAQKVQKHEEDKRQWQKSINRIFEQNGKFIPARKTTLLSTEGQIKKISILSLPTLYRERLEQFKRILIHQPKYISSVFGAANVGKSTLLTEVMQNVLEMREVYENAEQQEGQIKIIFPSNNDPLTFYDSFYVFNEKAKKIEYAKNLKPKDVLVDEYFENQSSSMTLFMDDRINFKEHDNNNFTSIHKERRQQISKINSMKEKNDKFDQRFLIIRDNLSIIASRDNRLSYLNKYLVLLDRAGYNDGIYNLVEAEKKDREIKELRKIKNETVLYCILSDEIMKSGDTTKEHLLQMMTNHDFEKIILCINMFIIFSQSGFMTQSQRKDKVKGFIRYICVEVPNYICKLLDNHIENLEIRKKKCKQEIKLKKLGTQQISNLYQKDKTIRLQLNRYKDEKIKYEKISKNFSSFWEYTKQQVDKGLSDELQKKICEKLKNYPFKNVHFYGLQNYSERYVLIKFLRNLSNQQLYKAIGRQSLYSIQKFYFNKLQALDKYQNDLEKYYSDLPNFLEEFGKLDMKLRQQLINSIKRNVENCFKNFQDNAEQINKSICLQRNKMNLDTNKPWENQLGKLLWKLFSDKFQILVLGIKQLRDEMTSHKKNLIEKMIAQKFKELTPWHLVINQMIELICKDIKQFFQAQIDTLVNKWNQMISAASQHLGFMVEPFVMKDALSYLKLPIDSNSLAIFQRCKQLYQANRKIKITNTKEKHDEFIKNAERNFKFFMESCNNIIRQSKYIISAFNAQNREKQFLLIALFTNRNQMQNEMQIEKRKVQDAIMELKLEYSQKLRKINYDMVLNCVTKYEEDQTPTPPQEQ